MKIKGDFEGIPGFWLDDDQSLDGKRWFATHYGWELIRKRVQEHAQSRCEVNESANCSGRTQWGHAHHVYGRGGGKRDDRPFVKGIQMLKWVCISCHDVVKIERRPPCSVLQS